MFRIIMLDKVSSEYSNMVLYLRDSIPFSLFVGNMNFLVADGVRFSHPLHHMGKTEKVSGRRSDLALLWLCIQSNKCGA